MDDVTLLPCPFCGEPPTINAGPIDQVSCENTRCPADVVSAPCYEFLDDAIAAWNTRAALTPASDGLAEALLDRAVEALEFYAPKTINGILFDRNDDAGRRAAATLAAIKEAQNG